MLWETLKFENMHFSESELSDKSNKKSTQIDERTKNAVNSGDQFHTTVRQ